MNTAVIENYAIAMVDDAGTEYRGPALDVPEDGGELRIVDSSAAARKVRAARRVLGEDPR